MNPNWNRNPNQQVNTPPLNNINGLPNPYQNINRNDVNIYQMQQGMNNASQLNAAQIMTGSQGLTINPNLSNTPLINTNSPQLTNMYLQNPVSPNFNFLNNQIPPKVPQNYINYNNNNNAVLSPNLIKAQNSLPSVNQGIPLTTNSLNSPLTTPNPGIKTPNVPNVLNTNPIPNTNIPIGVSPTLQSTSNPLIQSQYNSTNVNANNITINTQPKPQSLPSSIATTPISGPSPLQQVVQPTVLINPSQVNISQVSPTQISSTSISPTQINPVQINQSATSTTPIINPIQTTTANQVTATVTQSQLQTQVTKALTPSITEAKITLSQVPVQTPVQVRPVHIVQIQGNQTKVTPITTMLPTSQINSNPISTISTNPPTAQLTTSQITTPPSVQSLNNSSLQVSNGINNSNSNPNSTQINSQLAAAEVEKQSLETSQSSLGISNKSEITPQENSLNVQNQTAVTTVTTTTVPATIVATVDNKAHPTISPITSSTTTSTSIVAPTTMTTTEMTIPSTITTNASITVSPTITPTTITTVAPTITPTTSTIGTSSIVPTTSMTIAPTITPTVSISVTTSATPTTMTAASSITPTTNAAPNNASNTNPITTASITTTMTTTPILASPTAETTNATSTAVVTTIPQKINDSKIFANQIQSPLPQNENKPQLPTLQQQPKTQPLAQPLTQPSAQPLTQPTTQPLAHPSAQPFVQPSAQPLTQPSAQPLAQPSAQPSAQPLVQPLVQPAAQLSAQPLARTAVQPVAQSLQHQQPQNNQNIPTQLQQAQKIQQLPGQQIQQVKISTPQQQTTRVTIVSPIHNNNINNPNIPQNVSQYSVHSSNIVTTPMSMNSNVNKIENDSKMEEEIIKRPRGKPRGRKRNSGRKPKNIQNNKMSPERIATLNKLATPIRPPKIEEKPVLPELPQLNDYFLTNTKNVELQNFVQKEIIHDYSERVRDYHIRNILEEKRVEGEIKEREKMQRMITSPIGRKYFNLVLSSGNKGNRKTKLCNFNQKQLKEIAEKEEVLVPIRIDFDLNGVKFRDSFTWNLNETLITPEYFADTICEDFNLSHSVFQPLIVKAIKEQIDEYYMYSQMSDEILDIKDTSTVNDVMKNNIIDNDKLDELRMLIKLDIIIGDQWLKDQFEWDICNRRNNPEEFADKLIEDLGLEPEFKTAIAHSIREQIQAHVKSLYLSGYQFDGTPIQDDEIAQSFLVPVNEETIIRNDKIVLDFAPDIYSLNDDDIEKLERDYERESRRKRRQHRGRRAISLPDREPMRTNRTKIPKLSNNSNHEQSRTTHHTFSDSGRETRRAAVNAASNIANIVAQISSPSYYNFSSQKRKRNDSYFID